MKYIARFTRLFISKLFGASYYYEFLSEVPTKIPRRAILIISEGHNPDLIVFKCPCDCGDDIYLNILNDAKPRWDFKIKHGLLNLTPSIWRKSGCKSHFFIRESRVIWV
jgi:hypothetical protein